MKGTEKQIKWAEAIKANTLESLMPFSNTAKAAEFSAYIDWIKATKDSAAWWIDHREYKGIAFMRLTIAEFKASM